MKVVEGEFYGTVQIPVRISRVCHNPAMSMGIAGYWVRQKMRTPEGTWVTCPPNDVRILQEHLFTTGVAPGYYRFEIYGVEPD